jgi:hypothetical protein
MTSPPSCADCLEIWEPETPGTFRDCPGLYRDSFTFFKSIQKTLRTINPSTIRKYNSQLYTQGTLSETEQFYELVKEFFSSYEIRRFITALSNIHPFHALQSYLFMNHFNISLPSTLTSLAFRLTQHNPAYISSPHTCHMPNPSHQRLLQCHVTQLDFLALTIPIMRHSAASYGYPRLHSGNSWQNLTTLGSRSCMYPIRRGLHGLAGQTAHKTRAPRSRDQPVGKPSGEWIGRPYHYEGRDGLALYSRKMNCTFSYPSS